MGAFAYLGLALALSIGAVREAIQISVVAPVAQIHLILSGVLLFWLVRDDNGPPENQTPLQVVWVLSLFGMAYGLFVINGIIGVRALIRLDWQLWWGVAVGVPAFVYLFHLFASEDEEDDDAEEINDSSTVEVSDLLTPDAFSFDPYGALFSNLKSALWTAVGLPVGLCLLWFGYVEYRILADFAFEQREREFLSVLLSPLGLGFLEATRAWVTVVVVFTIFPCISAVTGFLLFAAHSVEKKKAPDSNRDLSNGELSSVVGSLQDMRDYLNETMFPHRYRAIVIVFICVLIGSLVAAPFAIGLAEVLLVDARGDALTAEKMLFAFSTGLPLSAFTGWLLGMMIPWALMQWAGGRNSRFAAYMFGKRGWNSSNDSERSYLQLTETFVQLLRTRRIKDSEPIDAEQVLAISYRQYEWLVYRITITLAVMTGLLFVLGVGSYSYADEDGITYSGLLEYGPTFVPYSRLSHVELKCFLYAKDDSGEQKLGLDYRVVTPSGISTDLLEEMPTSRPETFKLDGVERVHEKILRANIPIRHAKRAMILRPGEPGFRDDCGELVGNIFEPQMAERIFRIWK